MAVSWIRKGILHLLVSFLAYSYCEELEKIEPKPCELSMNGVDYKRETLAEHLENPYLLAVDYERNHLYFSYTVYTDNDTDSTVRNVDLTSKTHYEVKGVHGAFAPSIDRKTNKVIIGTDDGIFEHNPADGSCKMIGADDENIWSTYCGDKIYFITFITKKAYYLVNDTFKPAPRLENVLTELLVFDKNDRMYTSNTSGLFCFEKDATEASLVGDYSVNGLTTDKNGVVYFSTFYTLNKIDFESNKVQNLITLKNDSTTNFYGIAVDKDGYLLYSDRYNVHRLTPTDTKCDEIKAEDTDSTKTESTM